jgi:hypothetical protein
MKINDQCVNTLPPILREYITAMFDEKRNNIHVRQNYRDSIDYIRSVCDEAVRKFDRDTTRVVVNNTRKRIIRAAHAE